MDRYFPLYIRATWWSKRCPEAQNAAERFVRIARTADQPPPLPELPGNLPARREPEIAGSKVRGRFVEFLRAETDFRLVLAVNGVREASWLANPGQVRAQTKSGGPVDLHCGQPPGRSWS